jgi:hypothetical protein
MKKQIVEQLILPVLFSVPFLMACVACLVLLLSLTGCSTVSGVGKLMGGIGADIEDMAEGSRQRMKERN